MADEAASNSRVTELAIAYADALNQRGLPINGAAGQIIVKQSSTNFDVAWETPATGGDVVGPGSATDNGIALFDGTTGKLIKSGSAVGALAYLGVATIATGGTGQTTKSAGFNALSPITTAGDLIIGDGSNSATRLGIGSNGYILTSNGTTASWQPSGGGTGTVTSVDVSGGTTGLTFSGGPITTSGTITTGGTLAVANGGTNLTSYAVGDLIQASGSTTLAKLAAVATGNVLISGGVTTVSSWGKVGLTTHVSGTLPVANGGTGITSFGTGVATALGVNVGSAGAFVTFNGALGTPSSGTLTSCTGLPVGTGISGLGTGIAAALAINTGSAGAPVLFNGALGTPSSGTASSMTVDGTDAVGFRNIPVNSQSTAYTTVLADSGKTILHPTADNNARTYTIAANASVAYAVGTAITFANQINTVTIAINSDTLTLAGVGTTGSRTLAASGLATAVKIASTSWLISGAGLT